MMHKYYDLTPEQQTKIDKVSLGYFICADCDLDKAWDYLKECCKEDGWKKCELFESPLYVQDQYTHLSPSLLMEEVEGFSASMLNFYIPEFEKALEEPKPSSQLIPVYLESEDWRLINIALERTVVSYDEEDDKEFKEEGDEFQECYVRLHKALSKPRQTEETTPLTSREPKGCIQFDDNSDVEIVFKEENSDKTVRVSPSWLAHNGVPIDEEGDDMGYLRTIIKSRPTAYETLTQKVAFIDKDSQVKATAVVI